MELYMSALNWKIFIAVLIMAGLFRSCGTFEYSGYAGDEGIIIPAAKSVMEYGTGDWKNPQLTSFIVAGAIKLFGDNPVGWRISGIVCGTASILLLYLIARQLYSESSVPLLAASLLAFDPFDIHFTRTALMEPIAIFFFLLFMYLMLEYSERNRSTLAYAGIAMGLAIATKAYFVFAISVVVIYAFYRGFSRSDEGRPLLCIDFIVKLILLPVAIYLFSYTQWFGRGYSLPEFFQFRFDAYWIYDHNYKFLFEDILAKGGKPWEWFIKTFSFGHQLFSDGVHGRFVFEINNPLFRMMVLPSICFVVYHAVKKRRFQEVLAPLLFAACYILFFMAKRPFNSYSSLVLLPFAYLALAHAVVLLANRYKCEKEVTIIFLCVAFISECYLFPVTSGFLVRTDLYKPILSITHFTKAF
jgi:4-amino-4-deoxy-L-arabinose transferase-like glycosyltransferase